MTTTLTETPEPPPEPAKPAPAIQGGTSAVYVLGMIGAIVWFWRQATSGREKALAPLKAIVWPALLVYAAFKALKR